VPLLSYKTIAAGGVFHDVTNKAKRQESLWAIYYMQMRNKTNLGQQMPMLFLKIVVA
jgi:hypothetical protein